MLTTRVVRAVVALSGGTGSALVAYLVASVFEDSTILCIGKSAALQPEKLQRARFVADLLGIAQCPETWPVAYCSWCDPDLAPGSDHGQ